MSEKPAALKPRSESNGRRLGDETSLALANEDARATASMPWQPLTFRGVAAFGNAPWRRVWLVQFMASLAMASMCVAAIWVAWFPELEVALKNLPPSGGIRHGQLEWPGEAADLVAGKFLAVRVDPNSQSRLGHEADVGLELSDRAVRISSLLGYWDVAYPARREIPLNGPVLVPWWGAWKPALLVGAGLALALELLVSWNVLSFILAWPALLSGWIVRRAGGLKASWKTCGAGMIPGGLLMSLGILAYALQRLSLPGLLLLAVAHFLMGLLYAVVAPWFWPRRAGLKKNPFAEE